MREQDYYERGYDDEPRRSKKAKKRKRKQSGSRGERVVVTLLSLLFLTVAVVATVKYVVRAPEPVTDGEDQQTQQDGTAEDSDAIQTISNGKERKSKYCYNILLYGVDNDAGGSDTNMLMRFDAENKTVDIVSLPRDTLMSNGHKLNSSYNNGGTEKLRSNIEDMLGVPVDFYVSVDLKGFITLIDQIDGVDFDVPEDMDYDDPYQDLHIHFKKGLQHLNGQQAMEVVRFRHNNDNTGYGGQQDLGRIGRDGGNVLKGCQDRPDARQPHVACQPGAQYGRHGRHQLCHAPRRRLGLVQGHVRLRARPRAGARDDEFDAQPLCRRHHRRRAEHFSPVIPVKF